MDTSVTISSPRELAQSVCALLQSNGYQALLAGGCVRDELLKRAPFDFDVATDALPDQVIAIFPESLAVGAQFGVVQVGMANLRWKSRLSAPMEIIPTAGVPMQVIYTKSPEEDVQPARFHDQWLADGAESGKVLDFVGGQADLKAGLIRAIGDPTRRFAEDKLRLIRAVRFAARFGFAIEPATLAAIKRRRERNFGVSAERLRDELTKILTEGARGEASSYRRTGLLPFVLPEIAAMKGVEQPPQYHPEGDLDAHPIDD